MHFDTSENWLDERNHFMNLESEEVLRLRRLMHENILKVEKENLETIQKQLCNDRETNVNVISQNNDSKKTSKKPIGPSSSVFKTRSASFRGAKQQQSSLAKVQTSPNLGPSNINCANVCKNPQTMCQNSSIHFLNHFHASFLSSRIRGNLHPNDLKAKYTACAVPLAPPCQKKEIIDLQQDFAAPKSFANVPNNVAYHVVSEDVPKKLSIQVLPSISIIGRKPSNIENVRIEEIIGKNYSTGDCIKTTVLPAVSEEVRNRISNINLSSTQINEIPPSKNKNNQPSVLHPKKSIFTLTSENSESLPTLPDKGLLKDIIKEVLHEFQLEFPREFIKLTTDPNFTEHQSEQPLTSPENDCELDSFMANADSLTNEVATMVSPNIFVKSSSSQTTNCDPHSVSNEVNAKNLIRQVIQEMLENSSLILNPSIDKVHRDIQVDLKCEEINRENINCTSKAVQASFSTENETMVTAGATETPDKIDSFVEKDFRVISSPATLKNNEIPECQGENTDAAATAEMPSKLESVLNFVYNRFCKETGEISLSAERILPNPPSVRTREVSIQFNPISTSTKCTATSEVALVDASNQCDVLLPPQVVEKDMKHVSVQVLPESEMDSPVQEKVDSSVQWEKPVSTLRDSCVQTMEFLNPSENSANTSVSSTPVSDSIFLDDMLSEGEVFLPWNLRLLSHADKSTVQSSYSTTETSDKEKDYSLSEGEVPPKYLQQHNLAQSPSYDSSSEAYTDPLRYNQNASTPTQKHNFMSSPETESLLVLPHERCCHCQASGSSLSEGEVRGSSASLSEGEIPFGFLRQRLTFQHAFLGPSSSSVSNIPHGSGTTHRTASDCQNLKESSRSQDGLGYSNLDFSGVDQSQIPYQSTPYTSLLDTVNEEK